MSVEISRRKKCKSEARRHILRLFSRLRSMLLAALEIVTEATQLRHHVYFILVVSRFINQDGFTTLLRFKNGKKSMNQFYY